MKSNLRYYLKKKKKKKKKKKSNKTKIELILGIFLF